MPQKQLYHLFYSALKSNESALREVDLEECLCFVGLLQVNSNFIRNYILKKNNSQ